MHLSLKELTVVLQSVINRGSISQLFDPLAAVHEWKLQGCSQE